MYARSINSFFVKAKFDSPDKVKIVDCHWKDSVFLLCDEAGNVSLFDAISAKMLTSFNIPYLLGEKAIDVKFFRIDSTDLNFIADLKEIKTNNTLPFNLRENLLIVTTNKHVHFVSPSSKKVVKSIEFGTGKDVESNSPTKVEVFNHIYLIILTDHTAFGKSEELIIFNLLDWKVTKTFTKKDFSKRINNFFVWFSADVKQIIVFLADGSVNSLKINEANYTFDSLKGNKSGNRGEIFDYSVLDSSFVTISKASVTVNSTVQSIFTYEKADKFKAISVLNSSLFNKNSYLAVNTANLLVVVVLDQSFSQTINKNVNFICSFSLNQLDSKIPKDTKIYKIKAILGSSNYFVLGTNHGSVLLSLSNTVKSPYLLRENILTVENNSLKSLKLVVNKGELVPTAKTILKREVIQAKQVVNQLFYTNNYSVGCSFDESYYSVVDQANSMFSIFNRDFEHLLSSFCSDLAWCPFKRLFATTKRFADSYHKENSLMNASFVLTVYCINDSDKAEELFRVENIGAHRLFGFHLLGCFQPSETAVCKVNSAFDYNTPLLSFNCYLWDKKTKIDFDLKEEPLQAEISADMVFLTFRHSNSISVYRYLEDKLRKRRRFAVRAVDIRIVEDSVLLALTENGIYICSLTGNDLPVKLVEETNFNLELSREWTKGHRCDSIVGFREGFILLGGLRTLHSIKTDSPILKLVSLYQEGNFEAIPCLLDQSERKHHSALLSLLEYWCDKVDS